MPEKRDLDETDLEILRLLTEDARRSLRDIAGHVDLSAPAVSDRIDRLREQGIIRRFTVDIDRTNVDGRYPVLLTLEASPGDVEDLYEQVRRLPAVEHVFLTVDGRVVAQANAPDAQVGRWLRSTIGTEGIHAMDVTLLDAHTWAPTLDTATFSLSCAVCENPVRSDGIMADFGGETKAFCCPSCKAMYEERYEKHRSDA